MSSSGAPLQKISVLPLTSAPPEEPLVLQQTLMSLRWRSNSSVLRRGYIERQWLLDEPRSWLESCMLSMPVECPCACHIPVATQDRKVHHAMGGSEAAGRQHGQCLCRRNYGPAHGAASLSAGERVRTSAESPARPPGSPTVSAKSCMAISVLSPTCFAAPDDGSQASELSVHSDAQSARYSRPCSSAGSRSGVSDACCRAPAPPVQGCMRRALESAWPCTRYAASPSDVGTAARMTDMALLVNVPVLSTQITCSVRRSVSDGPLASDRQVEVCQRHMPGIDWGVGAPSCSRASPRMAACAQSRALLRAACCPAPGTS